MTDTFTERVLPVVQRWAAVRIKDDDTRAIALVLAWWAWQTASNRDLPPTVFARVAVWHALAGRDLPGVREHRLDVFDRLTQWQGGGMGEVMDRRPGPETQAAWKEEAAALYATLTAGERELWDAVEAGVHSTGALAAELDVSAPRVSQLRRQILTKARQ